MGTDRKFWEKPAGEVSHTARLKQYPGGGFEIMACSRPVFREKGYEEAGWKKPVPAGKTRKRIAKAEPEPDDIDRSRRRAAAKVRDLALCTEFKWFVTLTLNAQRVDRYDIGAVTRRMKSWLDNAVRRKGLAYVLVPELHKDGAIHFHGFFNGAFTAVDSGTYASNRWKHPCRPRSEAQRAEWDARPEEFHKVYNIPEWTFGFSTAIGLYGDYESAIGYTCKYVRKQGEKVGGRWFYSGGALGHPAETLIDVEWRELEQSGGGYSFAVPDAGLAFCIVRGHADACEESERMFDSVDETATGKSTGKK